MNAQSNQQLTIEYPYEVLWALQQEPDEFAAEARLLLALKLFETGKLIDKTDKSRIIEGCENEHLP